MCDDGYFCKVLSKTVYIIRESVSTTVGIDSWRAGIGVLPLRSAETQSVWSWKEQGPKTGPLIRVFRLTMPQSSRKCSGGESRIIPSRLERTAHRKSSRTLVMTTRNFSLPFSDNTCLCAETVGPSTSPHQNSINSLWMVTKVGSGHSAL